MIVASHIIGKRMRDDFGVAHDKIRMIPRGVNLEEFKMRDAEKLAATKEVIIGLVGRLTPIKGHPLFLKAMARVVRVYPHIKIQIIGDAPKPQYKEELMMLTRNLGLSQAVQFLGTRYNIPELLGKMSVLVAPSVGEVRPPAITFCVALKAAPAPWIDVMVEARLRQPFEGQPTMASTVVAVPWGPDTVTRPEPVAPAGRVATIWVSLHERTVAAMVPPLV